MNRTTARGLTDPAEDVCAAAARAVRLVMRRFLSLETPPSSGGETGIDTVEISKIDAERCSGGTGDGVEGGRHGSFERGGRRGGPGRSGHGRDVFDLVWKALEELDQDSSCVEVCAVSAGKYIVDDTSRNDVVVRYSSSIFICPFLYVYFYMSYGCLPQRQYKP